MNVHAHPMLGRGLTVAFIGVLAVFFLTACPSPEPEVEEEVDPDAVEEVTLSVAGFVPHREDFISAHAIVILPDIMDEIAPGMFNIEYAGGPETFPPPELFGYVDDGTVDMATLPSAFYGGDIFLAVAANYPQSMTPWEAREIGFHDWQVDLHAENGIKYLGYTVSGLDFHCYTQDRVEEPEDLAGIPMYGTTTTQSLLEAFGARVEFMPLPELYTAIERGVVEGMCQPDVSLVVLNEYYHFLNYIIDPGFYQLETSLIMNMESWEELSDEHQEALDEGIQEMERRAREFIQETGAEHREYLLEQGLEVIEFEGEAAQRWDETARAQFWHFLFDESDDHERIRELNRILRDAGYETHFPEEFEG